LIGIVLALGAVAFADSTDSAARGSRLPEPAITAPAEPLSDSVAPLPTRGVRLLDSTSSPSRTTTVRGHRRQSASVGQAERTLSGNELLGAKGGSFAEALERIPGVTSLKTGTVAKPMVNGLHSQRLVVVEDGIRLEGQSWGAEHAVESDPSRAGRVTVIQGGASVRHGQGAMGGVVVIEPAPADHDQLSGEWIASLRSNGPQTGSSLRLTGPVPYSKNLAWEGSFALRGSGDRICPTGVLPNTALREGSWSGLLEYSGDHILAQASHAVFWQHQGILSSSHIGNLTDLRTALAKGSPPDTATWRWSVGRPDQTVRHDVSRLRLQGNHTAWKWSALAGWQGDRRREWDLHKPIDSRLAALDLPELDYSLRTGTLDLEAEPRLDGNWQWRFGGQGIHQENEHDGRAFVPNFRALGGGVWSVLAFRRDSWSVDAGLRADVQSLEIWRRVAGQIAAWDNSWFAPSWSAGWQWRAHEGLTIRSGIGSGWRAPSAVELFADGLHHGVAAIERGDSTLVPEHSLTVQSSVAWKTSNSVHVQVSAWATRIDDFIFLRPDASPRLTVRGAFPSFAYARDRVWMAGADLSATVALSRSWEAIASGSAISTRDREGGPIPFAPASRIRAGFDWIPIRGEHSEVKVGPRLDWIAKTDPVKNDYAPPPHQVVLFGLEGFAEIGRWKLTLRGTNLANTTWRDPSDRLRYFAPQPGLDMGLTISRRI